MVQYICQVHQQISNYNPTALAGNDPALLSKLNELIRLGQDRLKRTVKELISSDATLYKFAYFLRKHDSFNIYSEELLADFD